MKKIFYLMVVMVVIFSFVISANATLVDNGNGTITQYKADGKVLMWLQDTNYAKTSGYDADGYMTWSAAMTWANGLSFAGHDDWRLPSANLSNGEGSLRWTPSFGQPEA